MRKKILSLVLACLMLVTAFGTTLSAVAAEVEEANAVAFVNNKYYDNLPEALTAAQGAQVTLLKSVSLARPTGDTNYKTAVLSTSQYGNINLVGATEGLSITFNGGCCLTTNVQNTEINITNVDIVMAVKGYVVGIAQPDCKVNFTNCDIKLNANCAASGYLSCNQSSGTFSMSNGSIVVSSQVDKPVFNVTAYTAIMLENVAADCTTASGQYFMNVTSSISVTLKGTTSITTNSANVINLSDGGSETNHTIKMYDDSKIRLAGSAGNANAIHLALASGKSSSSGVLTLELNDNSSIVTEKNMNTNYGSAVRANSANRDVVIVMRGNSYIDSDSTTSQGTIAVNMCRSFTLKMYDNAYIDSWAAYKTIKTNTVNSNIYLFDSAIIKANGYNTIKFWDYTNGHNTTIHAEYTTFSAYGQSASYKALDIISGASVRMVSEDTGIRFTVNLTNAINTRSKDELAGVIVAEYDKIDGTDFTKESLAQENYAGLEFAVPGDVGAEKSEFLTNRLDNDNNLKIALNIDEANYETTYAIRTYVKYNFEHKHSDNENDIRKFPLVIYSDFSVADHVRSIADVARRALGDTEPEETATHNCKIDEGVWSRYTKAQVEILKEIAGDYTGASTFTLANSNLDNPNEDTTGVYVRNVNIDASNVEGDTITVVQLNDVHFGTANSSTNNANNALTYAKNANADRVVVVGDVMSDKSQANIDAMVDVFNESTIFDPERIIMCIGNHDAREYQSGSETTSLKNRLALLEKVWKNNLYYSSDVIDEKVMIIQMDNASQAGGTGKSAFWAAQVPLLKADLDIARANGYVVLIFYHMPLNTNNSDMSATTAITAYGDAVSNESINYYDDTNLVGVNSTGASKQIYDLITNNADVIAATFCGHMHADYYTEIVAKTALGEDKNIPQYVLVGNMYNSGHVINITVS